MRKSLSFSVIFLALIPFAIKGQDVDVEPPEIQSLSISPTTVDVSGGNQSVTVSFRATDNLSGIYYVRVELRSSTGQYTWQYLYPGPDTCDFTGDVSLSVPQYSEAGTWTLRVTLRDQATNWTEYTASRLADEGFPAEVTVISDPQDLEGPTVSRIEISPNSVDVSTGPQTVTVTIEVSDNLSGLRSPSLWGTLDLLGPSDLACGSALCSGGPWVWVADPHLVDCLDCSDGTIRRAIYQESVVIPQYSEAGVWKIAALSLRDNMPNHVYMQLAEVEALGLDTELNVTSNPSDTEPPELTDIKLMPSVINTSTGDHPVIVSLELRDNLAGLDRSSWNPDGWSIEAYVDFRSPSGQQSLRVYADYFELVAGDTMNGRWEAWVDFPQFSEDGYWRVERLWVEDAARNETYLRTSDLEAKGLPTRLQVVRPSLESDGSVSWNGGIVEDDTFGTRASLTCPPGVLSGSTDVAIDVFSEPLNTPPPSGFEAPGTRFVNLKLTPEPAFPLPAPGMEVTLPTVRWIKPGTQLQLFRIDPPTGNLAPALDVNGLPVLGTVNSDGMSATFTGIGSLSIIVGVLPDAIPVTIDIKPGESTNSVNLGSYGNVPVAILSSASFDAQTVNPETVTLAGASLKTRRNGAVFAAIQDVNGDGLPDLVVHVETEYLQLSEMDQEAVLEGLTTDGLRIRGVDTVRIVP